MTSPNAQDNHLETNTGKKKNIGKNIESLFHSVTRDRRGGFDPYVYNGMIAGGDQKTKALKQVRDAMEASYNEEEYGFEKDTIENLKDSDILAYFAKSSRDIKALRQNFSKNIKRAFPNTNIPAGVIEDDFIQYSEKELSDITETPATIKKYLINQLGIPRQEIQSWTPKLRELFPIDQIEHSPDLKNRLIKAIDRFEKHHVPFDRELIRELIGFFDTKSDILKKVVEEFEITLSIKDALAWNILSLEQVDTATEKEFADIWTDISEDQRKNLKVMMRSDDLVQFSLNELTTKFSLNIDAIFGSKTFKEFLPSALKTRFTEQHGNQNGKELTTNFSEFLQKIEDKKLNIHMYPLDQVGIGSILVCRDRSGRMRFLKIEKIDQELGIQDGVAGLTLSFLDGVESGTVGLPKGSSTISYETFEQKLETMDEVQVMSEDDLRGQIESGLFSDENSKPIKDVSLEEQVHTFEYLEHEINKADPEGKNIEIDKGMAFVAKVDSDDGKTKGIKQTFRVLNIDKTNGTITFTNSRDTEVTTFGEFVEVIQKGIEFHRIAVLNNDQDFIKALSTFGVQSSATIEDHELKIEDEVEEDDGHGHKHTSKKKVSYEYFENDESHIRLTGINDTHVIIWEYNPGNGVDLEKLRNAKGAKKLSKSQEKSQYRITTLTREAFLVYLKEHKLKATTKDLLDSHAGHSHEQHMHGGGLMGMLKGPSINDIFKGFQNIIHGFEHYFEKNSKLNASRFALKMGRKFGFSDDLMAQLQADEVASMKEIIEKIQDKFSNLNGPVARKKALHIAQLSSSSAEEVGSSMIYMVKSYGHLYAEDIAYAQGSQSFINGFLYSLGWRGAEAETMKKTARSKYLADLGSGSDGGEPTEEEVIWGLLKIIDGSAGLSKDNPKYDPRFANAGAVVKAMGGPSGWEKAWRTEGIKNAYDKGIRQGAAVVNAEGRINKGLSALKTFELNTAMGFMEKAAGKTPDPSVQTIPVVWALGGYSEYCSTEMKQKVKGYGDSQGHTFHAYAFLRNKEDNDTYKNVFVKALSAIDPEKAKDAQEAINIIQKGPLNDNKETKKAYEDAIDTLTKIWKDYQGKGLHDHLQGKSTWMIKKINEGDKDVEKYAKRFAGIHMMNSSETHPSDDNAWWIQYGYNANNMFGDNKGNATKKKDEKQVLSLDGTLNKLRIDGYEFQKDAHDRLWPAIVNQFKALEGETDPDMQKAQYKQYREDLITHFRRMSIRGGGGIEAAVGEVKRREYYKDIVHIGLDPYDFFVHTPIDINAEKNYQSWLRHKGSGVIQSESVIDWAKTSTRQQLSGSGKNSQKP